MNKVNQFPIFDGHNDTLQMLYMEERKRGGSFFEKSAKGHIDLPRAVEGGLCGGLFSIFSPSKVAVKNYPGADLSDTKTSYALPMVPPLDFGVALDLTLKGMAGLFRLEAESEGKIKVVTAVDELEVCLKAGILAVVLHIEGADTIDTDLDCLFVFYRAGLRALALAWSRDNAFAHGVPYRFPHSPDVGPGLTDLGRNLVKKCNDLGIMLDVSHLNEKGFWDIEKLTDSPIVATHSGAHALCPSSRNLTDKQLDAVKASDGLVGVNFHVAFLREDGHLDENTPISEIVRHMDYIAERIGIDHVAFGSDFDGATMPKDLKDAAGLPKLIDALRDSGYEDGALAKLTHQNWLRVFRETWKKTG